MLQEPWGEISSDKLEKLTASIFYLFTRFMCVSLISKKISFLTFSNCGFWDGASSWFGSAMSDSFSLYWRSTFIFLGDFQTHGSITNIIKMYNIYWLSKQKESSIASLCIMKKCTKNAKYESKRRCFSVTKDISSVVLAFVLFFPSGAPSLRESWNPEG